jgi:RNA polymerase sigma-70 factor (ECF subfamily)
MNPSEMDNAELLRACVDKGAVEEWAEFIARFQPLIAGVISRTMDRICGAVSAQLVDDLIQETYLRLCRNDCRVLREFRAQHEASFFGYLKEMASSVARDHFRAQRALHRGPQSASLDEVTERHTVDHRPPPEDLLVHAEIWRRVEEVAESERDVTVFKLYYRQGFTAREIAAVEELHLSEKGVESCLYRLVCRLRESLNSAGTAAGKKPRITFGGVG